MMVGSQWQPAETAPRDGSHILACGEGNYGPEWGFDQQPPTVVHWFGDGFYTSVNERAPEHPFALAFWMALPLPPARCSCGGARWIDDEGWEPDDPSIDWTRAPADGLVPCGFCNFAGWSTPYGKPEGASE